MSLLGVVLSAMVVLTSCAGTSDAKAKEAEAASAAVDAGQAVSEDPSAGAAAKEAGIAELLQGKWQHTDDKSNYLVFEGNHRKETAGGTNQWDDEIFVLSDHCENPSDKDNGIEPEKDRYLSCPASDLCWYIIGVDSETLSLSYMGRGNTLTYNRVK